MDSLSVWQWITLGTSLAALFLTVLKLLFVQFGKTLDSRFTSLDENFTSQLNLLNKSLDVLEDDVKQWRKLERDFLTFRAELPNLYVRREDWIRNQTIIESKLDSLAVRLENNQLRSNKPL